MFVPSLNKRIKNNISPDTGYFLRTEIDSRDFKIENFTTKRRRK